MSTVLIQTHDHVSSYACYKVGCSTFLSECLATWSCMARPFYHGLTIVVWVEYDVSKLPTQIADQHLNYFCMHILIINV